jgi:glycosyltransferase involved in cell wall biosynthesis
MARVLIIQSNVKRYRVPFFAGLQADLRRDGIKLVVAYSDQNRIHALRQDQEDLPNTFGMKVQGHWFFDKFVYQHVWDEVWMADLVIVGPEVKFLINPLLLSMSFLRLKKVAFWGLGPNMHPDRSEVTERIKERMVGAVDWWFAYTPSVRDYLKERGVPSDRITNVQNATDTIKLRTLMGDISQDEAAKAKEQLTGIPNSKIGFYCGLIGTIKALPLLLKSARLVKDRYPEFHLVIVGSGPDREWLRERVEAEPWIHYLGSKYGRESALLYKIADLFLLAGTAGLSVVDSFAAGLPMIATRLNTHPPEVTYLRDGENSILTAHDPECFADAIVEALTNESLMARLRQGAIADGSRYTIETMIENYGRGIRQCFNYYGIPFGSDVDLEPWPDPAAVS